MTRNSLANPQDVNQLEHAWVEAELGNDAEALGRLLTDDFICIGPLGFVLNKEQYLQPRRNGDMQYEDLDWTDEGLRVFGESGVAVGTQTQRASYQGRDASGQFRVTQVLVPDGDRLQIASLHYSPIAKPPVA